MATTISPRGCSRAFIIRVLTRALAYVSELAAVGPINFPFPHADIDLLLTQAREDCVHATDLQEAVGGTVFDNDDPETYWNHSVQFLTWWKNNIERKSKFQALIRDADSSKPGVQTIKGKRSFYCRMAIALSTNIRNHFIKHVNENGGLVQVTIPSMHNTHPSLERFLLPMATQGPPRKNKKSKVVPVNSENSLEGLDLLSHTISSQGNVFEEEDDTRVRVDGRSSDLDESDVLGMGGLLSLRAYNPEADAVTFCENIYSRSIPPPAVKEQKKPKAKATRREDDAAGNPFREMGFSLTQRSPDGAISVCGVVRGSVAYTCGLRSGDVVTHVDGEEVRGRSAEEVLQQLQTDARREVPVPYAGDFFTLQEELDIRSSIAMLSDEAPPAALDSQATLRSDRALLMRLSLTKRARVDKARVDTESGYKRPRVDKEDSEDEAESEEDAAPSRPSTSRKVSSLGCSRGFIVSALARVLEHVKERRRAGPVAFPLSNADMNRCLELAAGDCQHNKEFQLALGGTQFDAADPSSFWTRSAQFFTWWKNNIERRSKFIALKRDSAVCAAGDCSGRARRSLYCRVAVALATNIRSYCCRGVQFSDIEEVPVPTLENPDPPRMGKASAAVVARMAAMEHSALHQLPQQNAILLFGEAMEQDDAFKAAMDSFEAALEE